MPHLPEEEANAFFPRPPMMSYQQAKPYSRIINLFPPSADTALTNAAEHVPEVPQDTRPILANQQKTGGMFDRAPKAPRVASERDCQDSEYVKMKSSEPESEHEHEHKQEQQILDLQMALGHLQEASGTSAIWQAVNRGNAPKPKPTESMALSSGDTATTTGEKDTLKGGAEASKVQDVVVDKPTPKKATVADESVPLKPETKPQGGTGGAPKQQTAAKETPEKTKPAPVRRRKRAAGDTQDEDSESKPARKGRKRAAPAAQVAAEGESESKPAPKGAKRVKQEKEAQTERATEETEASTVKAGSEELFVSQDEHPPKDEPDSALTTATPTAPTAQMAARITTSELPTKPIKSSKNTSSAIADPDAQEAQLRERFQNASRRARVPKDALKAANTLLKVQATDAFDPAGRWKRVRSYVERFVVEQGKFEKEAKASKKEYMRFVEEQY